MSKKGDKMRWIEFIYKQYLDDLEGKEMDADIKINGENIKLIKNLAKTIKPKPNILKNNITKGDIFNLNTLYFVLSDTEEYPYEVLLVSPYWELASDKDLIVETYDKSVWVLESVVRYVTEDILKKALKTEKINNEDIDVMRNFIFNNKPLPKSKRGLFYPKGYKYYQELFKKKETERSLVLTVESISEDEYKIPKAIINLDIKKSKIEIAIIQALQGKMAAFSFEKFLHTKFGEIIKKDKYITLNFNDEIVGIIAKVYLGKNVLYEGVIPEKLNITTNISHIEDIRDNMKIEFL